MRNIIIYIIVGVLVILPFAFMPDERSHQRKVVVLGFDGMDPVLLEEMMEAGELPNFDRLRKSGTFMPLGTSNPPQSPVSWSSFITGNNPGKHNVFDFITRDPENYYPKMTIAEVEKPETFDLGEYLIPLEQPVMLNYRKGKPFWQVAKEHGIKASALLVPVTFPPDEHSEHLLSGMGVPDVLGTNGTFSFYTTSLNTKLTAEGGKIIEVDVDDDGKVRAVLYGPENSFKKEGGNTTIPLVIDLAEDHATVHVQGADVRLTPGQWSGWVHIEFDLIPTVSVKAICRFYLKSITPEFELYASPVNFDPEEPAVQISNPPQFSAELVQKIGSPYYTQGMPEDTWALTEERISDEAFLELTDFIQDERLRIFFSELSRFNEGILSAVFVSSDRVEHMFWRVRDKEHPLYSEELAEKFGNAIEDAYKHMDGILGRTMKYIDEDTLLVVVSDHGFQSFRRAVHMNSWLITNGFMSLKDTSIGEAGLLFENVDWEHTKAYAIGLNSIYLNIKGREHGGSVDPADARAVKQAIIEKLTGLKDKEDGGANVVRRVFDSDDIYSGDYKKYGPDLVVGYDKGYRGSWQTALGAAPKELFEDNKMKWSGDHCVDPALVPGIFLSNRKIAGEGISIMDIAPSVLGYMGVSGLDMDGRAFEFTGK